MTSPTNEVTDIGSIDGGGLPARDRRRPSATKNRRRARSSHELTALFESRNDLEGVSPVADFFVESVRWSA